MRLFQYCDITTETDLNLSRIKKQLLAEFNAANTGFIELDGYSYARQEVFEEIERSDFIHRLTYHKKIWNSPAVLRLLEKNEAEFVILRKEFSQFWDDEIFDLFFSPYFCGPFAHISRNLLTQQNLVDLAELYCYEGFLGPGEREEAFKPIRVFLSETQKLLRNVNAENYKIMRPKIAYWIDKDWHPFFNRLPQEFYNTKADIVIILINIGVSIQKTHRRDCRKMSRQLASVEDLPENLRDTILSNHTIYNRSGLRSRNNWWMGWVIFMVVKILLAGSCT